MIQTLLTERRSDPHLASFRPVVQAAHESDQEKPFSDPRGGSRDPHLAKTYHPIETYCQLLLKNQYSTLVMQKVDRPIRPLRRFDLEKHFRCH